MFIMNNINNNIVYSLELFKYAIKTDNRLAITVLKNNIAIFVGVFYKIKDEFILSIGETTQYNVSEGVNFLIESKYCTAIKHNRYLDLILTKKALLILL